MNAVLAANPRMVLTQSGNVVVGDEAIDTSSLMGVVDAVVMNARARGEDPAAAVDYLRAEMLKKARENPPLMIVWEDNAPSDTSSDQVLSRSFHFRCPSWDSARVYGHSCRHWGMRYSIPYTFNGKLDDFSDKILVEAVEAAMREWTRVTGGKIKFHRATGRDWRDRWGKTGILDIARIDGGASHALVGYGVGLREVRISDEVLTRPASPENLWGHKDPWFKLKRHTRHELGHAIGFLHEHQRWDRDAYVEIPSDYGCNSVNCDKIDFHSTMGMHWLKWELQAVGYYHHYVCTWRSLFDVTCRWERREIKIWVPVWEYTVLKTEQTGYVSHFDWDSVMLYPGLFVKPDPNSLSSDCFVKINGRAKTKYNVEISPQDAATAAGLANQW